MSCTHFGSCGGCTLQNLSYEEQIERKSAFIETLFPHPFKPLIGCEKPFGYRGKMEFSFGYVKGELLLGLYKQRGQIEDLHECPLSPAWFMEVVQLTREWGKSHSFTSYYPPRDRGHLRTLTLRDTKKGRMAILTVSGNPDYALPREALDLWVSLLPGYTLFLCTQVIKKKTPTQFLLEKLAGDDLLEEKLSVTLPSGETASFSFFLSPLSFLQPNPRQAERLYEKALALAAIEPHEVVLDLYCGIGTLTHFASLLARQVIGVEINPEAIECAKRNAELNHRDNLLFFQGDIGDRELPYSPSLIILDPPRSGLTARALQEVLRLKPARLLYISCNPVTQKRDCDELEKEGFSIQSIQPVDLFPQTDHVENIVLLCASK